jgi:hypothetical protein
MSKLKKWGKTSIFFFLSIYEVNTGDFISTEVLGSHCHQYGMVGKKKEWRREVTSGSFDRIVFLDSIVNTVEEQHLEPTTTLHS